MEYPNASPTLGFTEAISRAANNILNTNGRSRRSEFWWTILVAYVATYLIPAGFIITLFTIPLTIRRLHDTGRSGWWLLGSVILSFVLIGMLIYDFISIILSGAYIENIYFSLITLFSKYILLTSAALIYKIVLLIFCCMDSDPYPNQYGESPKYSFDNK
ncbi:MAG: DUF805 domain-containing protein [Bacteroidaceae bacterium]|nr:DUF805 domain-containing protein [Bacteroidaceae bacterium]